MKSYYNFEDILALSESTKIPILCDSEEIDSCLFIAKWLHYNIPNPITIFEYLNNVDASGCFGDIIICNTNTLLNYTYNILILDTLINDCKEICKNMKYADNDSDKKIQLTKSEALSLLGFDENKYEIIDNEV